MKMILSLLVLAASSMANAQQAHDLCTKFAGDYADRCAVADGGRSLVISGLDGVSKVKISTSAAEVCDVMQKAKNHCIKSLMINPSIVATELLDAKRESTVRNDQGVLILDLNTLVPRLDSLALRK